MPTSSIVQNVSSVSSFCKSITSQHYFRFCIHSHLLSCLHLYLSHIKSFNCPYSLPSIISCTKSILFLPRVALPCLTFSSMMSRNKLPCLKTRGRPNVKILLSADAKCVAEINYLLSVETEYSAKIASWYLAETGTECGRKQNTCTKSTTLSINCGYFFRPHSNLLTIHNIFHNVLLTQRTFQSESVVEIK